jgi:acyl carrier protein
MAMDEVCRIIEKALGVDPGTIGMDDNSDTVVEWDSLGFLNILSALEERYSNEVANIDDLGRAGSVREIAEILKRESIISA